MAARGDLTEIQRKFAYAYAGPARGNGVAACKLAGCAGDDATLAVSASKMLRLGKVVDFLRTLTSEVEDDSMCTSVEIRRFLSGVIRGEECRVPIITMAGPVFEADGETIKTKPADPKDRVKAATEYARMCGYYAAEKSEVQHSGQIVRIVLPDNGRGPRPDE